MLKESYRSQPPHSLPLSPSFSLQHACPLTSAFHPILFLRLTPLVSYTASTFINPPFGLLPYYLVIQPYLLPLRNHPHHLPQLPATHWLRSIPSLAQPPPYPSSHAHLHTRARTSAPLFPRLLLSASRPHQALPQAQHRQRPSTDHPTSSICHRFPAPAAASVRPSSVSFVPMQRPNISSQYSTGTVTMRECCPQHAACSCTNGLPRWWSY